MTSDEVDHDQQNSEGRPLRRTPLPKFQLFIVYLCLYAEPITATVIYPFAPQFVKRTGITGGDEKKIGYYAGIVESIFFITECLTVYLWAQASNVVGRRPILVMGPLGLSVAMLCFGLSTSFWQLVLFRGFQGTFNAAIGVGKTVIAELSDATNIAYAFSFEPAMWCTGVILGPLIGGIFAEPAKEFPNSLGKLQLFRDFPFLLPCLIAAGCAFSFFVVGSLGLKETYPRSRRRQSANSSNPDEGGQENYGSLNPPPTSAPEDHIPSPSLRKVFTRRLARTLVNHGFLAFYDMAINALIPLMFSTSVESGGLGLTSTGVGTVLGLRGSIGAVLPFFFAPVVQSKGPRPVFIGALCCVLASITLFPVVVFLARQKGRADALVWVIIIVQTALSSATVITYSSLQVIIVDNASSKPALAKINSIAQMTSTSMRTLAPVAVSSLYALTVEKNVLGGYMVYLVLFVVLLAALRASFLLPKGLQNLKSHMH